LFAAAGILLATIGVYGVLSYAVLRRTTEIGVRLALGAERRTIIHMVVVDALTLIGGGLLVGIPLALAATLSVRSLLFGVGPFDWMAIVSASTILVGAGFGAAYAPARRASSVNPLVALRSE